MWRAWIITTATILIASASGAGTIEGQVELTIDGATFADLGPVVAFLSAGPKAGPPPPAAEVRQVNAEFEPDFLVVSEGQEVSMPNMDTIFHNVFSFSLLNHFDLGLYPKGETRTVKMEHAGVVHIYCSIHESMTGVILIAPTPHFARVDSSGRFSIPDVPAGDYEITIWNERLPDSTRDITLDTTETLTIDLAIPTAGS